MGVGAIIGVVGEKRLYFSPRASSDALKFLTSMLLWNIAIGTTAVCLGCLRFLSSAVIGRQMNGDEEFSFRPPSLVSDLVSAAKLELIRQAWANQILLHGPYDREFPQRRSKPMLR